MAGPLRFERECSGIGVRRANSLYFPPAYLDNRLDAIREGGRRHEAHFATVVADRRVCGRRRLQRRADARRRSSPAHAAAASSAAAAATERIVYSSLRPGNWDIYYFASAGAAPRRLTDHPGLDYDAALSPDGRWVVFTSERRGNPDLYALEIEAGGEPRLLIDSPAMEDQVAFSPDGRSIAFVSTASGNADIYVLPFMPETPQTLAAAINVTNHPGGDFRPDFSPDGARIAFTTDRDTPVSGHPIFAFTRQREGDVYVMDRDGGNAAAAHDDARLGRLARVVRGRPHAVLLFGAAARDRRSADEPDLGARGRLSDLGDERRRLESARRDAGRRRSARAGRDGRMAASRIRSARALRAGASSPSPPTARARAPRATWRPTIGCPIFTRRAARWSCTASAPPSARRKPSRRFSAPARCSRPTIRPTSRSPDRTVTLYPMRHTTGLAPHPDRNETAVTIENEAGTRLVLADFDGANQRELFAVPNVGIVSGTPNRLFDIKWSDDGDVDHVHARLLLRPRRGRGRCLGHARRRLRAAQLERGTRPPTKASRRSRRTPSKLVFRSARNGRFDLYLTNRDGTEPKALTSDEARENFPVFSPSGDTIAFSSNRDGARDSRGNLTFDNYLLARRGRRHARASCSGSPIIRARTRTRGSRRTASGSSTRPSAAASATRSRWCKRSCSARRCTASCSRAG